MGTISGYFASNETFHCVFSVIGSYYSDGYVGYYFSEETEDLLFSPYNSPSTNCTSEQAATAQVPCSSVSVCSHATMSNSYSTIVYIYPPTGLPNEQINFTMPISNVYYLTGNPNSWSLMAYIYLFLILIFGAILISSFIASVRHYTKLQKIGRKDSSRIEYPL